jgi:cysteinyl-tRNA synthetase
MYDVRKFGAYGKLSGRKLEDLRAGARVEVDEAKRDPLDFVLWKHAKPDEPAWPSPWGDGRPGWHIECSAMSVKELGDHFDIHGGGLDLKFPHHENEIAQTCGARDAKFADIWMHNGFLNIDNEKMSKSLGNFFTARDVIKEVGAEALRMFLLSSHYRGPMNYSRETVWQAKTRLKGLCRALLDAPPSRAFEPSVASDDFKKAMDDDFNTPEALGVLSGLATSVHRNLSSGDMATAAQLAAELKALGDVLGVLPADPAEYFQRLSPPVGESAGTVIQVVLTDGVEVADQTIREILTPESIQARIDERLAARKAKNWAESDRIRKELADQGVILEDKPGGTTTWRRA